jgi:type VI protein secretion system component VasF
MNDQRNQIDPLLNLLPESSRKRQTAASSYQPYLRAGLSSCQPKTALEAASAFFTCVMRFKQKKEATNQAHMIDWLEHECALFENHMHQMNYQKPTLLAGSYVLRLWAYDQLMHLLKPQNCHVLEAPENEENQSDAILNISQFCCQSPQTYIDLLELLYLCLKTGYQGNQSAEKKEVYRTMTEQVYQCLLDHSNFNLDTLLPLNENNAMQNSERSTMKRLLPKLALGLLTLILFSSWSYTYFYTPPHPPMHLTSVKSSHVPKI